MRFIYRISSYPSFVKLTLLLHVKEVSIALMKVCAEYEVCFRMEKVNCWDKNSKLERSKRGNWVYSNWQFWVTSVSYAVITWHNTAAKRLRMRKFVAVIRAFEVVPYIVVPTTTSHRRLSETQTFITTFKKGVWKLRRGISEYVTMLTMKPC